MPHSRNLSRRLRLGVLVVSVALVVGGCGGAPDDDANLAPTSKEAKLAKKLERSGKGQSTAASEPAPEATETANADGDYSVDPPGPLTGPLYTADVLITAKKELPGQVARRVADIKGVTTVEQVRIASASVNGRTLTVAAVDPGQFRRFAPAATAQAEFVWERLAGGEAALDDDVSKRLVSQGDFVALGSGEDVPDLHVGAFGPLPPGVQALVNVKRGEQLGMKFDNALVVSTGTFTPSALDKPFKQAVRPWSDEISVQTLALEFDVGARRTAVLTSQSVNDAVGTFSYTNRPNGEVAPDPKWIAEYIRTEEVPILGTVTCNKAVLPQLRAALQEMVERGMSDEIIVNQYAGCYYPRYIGRSAENGLSLHSWGIALDMNTFTNQRGTQGTMSPQMVSIFKKWGFAWGGDWNYTDPMHFEMNKVVRPG